MYIVITQDNKIIRNFEDGKVTVFDTKKEAETLAQIVNGKVYSITEEELKIANKKRNRK